MNKRGESFDVYIILLCLCNTVYKCLYYGNLNTAGASYFVHIDSGRPIIAVSMYQVISGRWY